MTIFTSDSHALTVFALSQITRSFFTLIKLYTFRNMALDTGVINSSTRITRMECFFCTHDSILFRLDKGIKGIGQSKLDVFFIQKKEGINCPLLLLVANYPTTKTSTLLTSPDRSASPVIVARRTISPSRMVVLEPSSLLTSYIAASVPSEIIM